MPAHRSRTERWRESLQQIYQRGGGIEFSLDSHRAAAPGNAAHHADVPDLMWRVRVIGLSEEEILVEQAGAAGTSVHLTPGSDIIGVLAVGQNRWMFQSRLLGPADGASPWGAATKGLRLAMPHKVERCPRRDFLRVSTTELHLPQVECWPLLNPMSVSLAEAANSVVIHGLEAGTSDGSGIGQATLPEVGPRFHGQLMNIGGGGLGLIFSKEDAAAADRCRLVWMRIDLRPVIPAPLAVTARFVHKHLDSGQNLIAGAAFDFSFNQPHREFVVEQIMRYVDTVSPLAHAKAA